MDRDEIEFIEVRPGVMIPAHEFERRRAWRRALKRWIDENGADFCVAMLVLASAIGYLNAPK